jgi:hypothetical protein
MAQKQTTKNAAEQAARSAVKDEPVEDDSAVDRDDAPETAGVAVEDEVDQFADLFGDKGDGNAYVVQLNRISPKSEFLDPETNQPISYTGYLEDLPLDLPSYSYREYVKERWGGGKYQAQRKVKGRIVNAATFEIAGKPPLASPAGTASRPKSQAPTPNLDDPLMEGGPVIERGGMQFDLSQPMGKVMELLILSRTLDTVMPQKEPIDAELLRALLENRQPVTQATPDLAEQIGKLGAVMAAVKELGGGGESATGKSWADLLDTALNRAGDIIQGAQGRSPQTSPLQQLTAPNPGAANIDQSQEQEGAVMPRPKMSMLDQAHYAARVVLQSFITQMEPARVVRLLDNQLGLDADQRAKVKSRKDDLLDIAENALPELYADGLEADTVKKFRDYFNQVFDLYTDPERQSNPLEDK